MCMWPLGPDACATCPCFCSISPGFFPHVPVAVAYVLSMHLLNNLTGNHAARYNDPDRADFYTRFQFPLILLALAAGATGLASAYTMGPVPFSILLVMSLLGLSYNLKVLPAAVGRRVGFRSLRDIPGSKTILIALAWGIVIALLPALYEKGRLSWAAGAMYVWTCGLLFVRSAFFDILDMQGDRIVGKETLPILIGEKKSLALLKAILVFFGGDAGGLFCSGCFFRSGICALRGAGLFVPVYQGI